MKEIRGDAKNIRALLSGSKYAIDYYQREYRWETKHIAELLEDLTVKFRESYEVTHERSAVENYGHYFLGSIIISDRDGKKFIIDGQQRLTSLTLLLIFIHRTLPDAEQKTQLSELIFSQKFGKKSFNLDVSERTACMEALYAGLPFEENGKSESVNNILGRYRDIEEQFQNDLRGDALPFFADWLLENVHLVEITAYSDEDAYTIFETMNDRGLSLTPTDMLKGYLLANITDDELRNRTSKVWRERLTELQEWGKEEDADAIKSWLRSQHAQKIRERKKGAVPEDYDLIGTEFHRWVRDHEKVLGLKASSDFARFIERDYSFYTRQYVRLRSAGSELTAGLESVFYNAQNNFTLQYALLLAPLRPEDAEVEILRKLQVVGAFLDILIARRIWNWRAIDYSTMQYAMFVVMKEIRGLPAAEIAAVLARRLADEPETFSSNDRFALHGMNRRQIQQLLSRMTDYLETSSGMASRFTEYVSSKGQKAYEVEHIWANHAERHTDEFKHPSEFQDYRNRIGGLLLLPKSFNASYGDLPYAQKRKHYLKQNLLAQTLHEEAYQNHPGLARLLKDSGLAFKPHPDFKKADLDQRSTLYLHLAEQIWNPDRLNEIAGIPLEQTKSKAAVKFPSNPYDNYLWKCLLEGGTADEIAAKVADHFAEDPYKVRRNPKTALKWIPETIDDMKAVGLVPKLK